MVNNEQSTIFKQDNIDIYNITDINLMNIHKCC